MSKLLVTVLSLLVLNSSVQSDSINPNRPPSPSHVNRDDPITEAETRFWDMIIDFFLEGLKTVNGDKNSEDNVPSNGENSTIPEAVKVEGKNATAEIYSEEVSDEISDSSSEEGDIQLPSPFPVPPEIALETPEEPVIPTPVQPESLSSV